MNICIVITLGLIVSYYIIWKENQKTKKLAKVAFDILAENDPICVYEKDHNNQIKIKHMCVVRGKTDDKYVLYSLVDLIDASKRPIPQYEIYTMYYIDFYKKFWKSR